MLVAPVPAPVTLPPRRLRLRASGSIGAVARTTNDQGTGLGTVCAAVVQGSGSGLVEIGASWAWTPQTDPANPDRDLVSTSVWAGIGWHVRPPLPAVVTSIGGMGRRYRFEGSTVAAVDVPWLGVGLIWDPPRPSGDRAGLRLSARVERDLRQTVLANLDGDEGPVSPWGVSLGIAGRWGAALGTRDTASDPSSARQKKSPSP